MAAQGWRKRQITNLIEENIMEKYIVNGMVAVLYSPRFGAGWSTWNNAREWNGHNLGEVLLYAPAIVEMVLAGIEGSVIEAYCDKFYGEHGYYFGGADGLTVEWMPVGTEFVVNEYDGSESIQYKETSVWYVA
jgi:hypothetical protein